MRAVLAALVVAAGVGLRTAGAGQAESVPPVSAGASPTPSEVARAVARVEADPGLAATRKVRTLRWRASPAPQMELPPWLGWLRWLRQPITWFVRALTWVAGAFAWLAQTARMLLWTAAATLAALLVVYLWRLVRSGRDWRPTRTRTAPTHVRDLDIRPDSLPADIGAAARALWDGGARREALALLYRGLLSRLAHVHGAAILDSSTEGDCIAQASLHLDGERAVYVARLVGTWQRAVYGGAAVDASAVHALCNEFADALDRRACDAAPPAAAVFGASA